MNIIYKLENLSKNGKGKRFYIGQKCECRTEVVNGVLTIINNKTELPYFGSSSDSDMNNQVAKGDTFEASVLEIVPSRKDLHSKEDFYIRKYDAVNSKEFYNKSYPLDFNYSYNHNDVKNIYGELVKEYASRESSVSKRVNRAKKLGFKNLVDFYKDIYHKLQETNNLSEIARSYELERHYVSRLIEDVNISKFYKEVSNKSAVTKSKIVDMICNGASVKYVAMALELEFATVLDYIGIENFKDIRYFVAKRKGMTEDQLGREVLKLFLEGKSLTKISKELSITITSAKRYLYRFIRKHVKINDFDGILNNE